MYPKWAESGVYLEWLELTKNEIDNSKLDKMPFLSYDDVVYELKKEQEKKNNGKSSY